MYNSGINLSGLHPYKEILENPQLHEFAGLSEMGDRQAYRALFAIANQSAIEVDKTINQVDSNTNPQLYTATQYLDENSSNKERLTKSTNFDFNKLLDTLKTIAEAVITVFETIDDLPRSLKFILMLVTLKFVLNPQISCDDHNYYDINQPVKVIKVDNTYEYKVEIINKLNECLKPEVDFKKVVHVNHDNLDSLEYNPSHLRFVYIREFDNSYAVTREAAALNCLDSTMESVAQEILDGKLPQDLRLDHVLVLGNGRTELVFVSTSSGRLYNVDNSGHRDVCEN